MKRRTKNPAITTRATAVAAMALMMHALTGPAQAASYYWDTDVAANLQFGDGNWDTTTTKWSTATSGSNPLVAWADGNDAYFQTTGGSSQITVAAGTTLTPNKLCIGANIGRAVVTVGDGTVGNGATLTVTGGNGLNNNLWTAPTAQAGQAMLDLNSGTATFGSAIQIAGGSGVGQIVLRGSSTMSVAGDVGVGYNSGGGSINIGGSSSFTTTNSGQLLLARTHQSAGIVSLSGASTTTIAGAITLGMRTTNTSVASNATLTVADSATLTAPSMTVAGLMQATVSVQQSGQFYQSGGTVTINGSITLCDTTTGTSAINKGSINLAGGTLQTSGKIAVGTAGTGIVEPYVNFRGGTLAYTGTSAQTDFLSLGASGKAFIYEGATIDDGGQSVTIATPLLAATGSGLASIPVTAGGANYYTPPSVRITGGGGSGATAVVQVNTAGVITGILVTNPGINYTSAPTVALERGGGSGVTLGTITTADNTTLYTGGLTKKGSGDLTLSAVNTYTGNTIIEAGTLTLAAGARLKFVIPATSPNGNNTLTGAGTAVLDGDFYLDTTLTDASELTAGTWLIENVTTLTGPYGGTFRVVDSAGTPWTDAGSDKWTKTVGSKVYTFDETTGTLTLGGAVISTPFETWVGNPSPPGYGLTGDNAKMDADPDSDGQNNLIEFALDGNPTSGALNAKVYVFTSTSDYSDPAKALILTIAARKGTGTAFGEGYKDLGVAPSTTKDGVKYTIEGGTDLSFGGEIWKNSTQIPANINELHPLSSTDYEYLSFILGGSENLPGKGFMRVKVEQE